MKKVNKTKQWLESCKASDFISPEAKKWLKVWVKNIPLGNTTLICLRNWVNANWYISISNPIMKSTELPTFCAFSLHSFTDNIFKSIEEVDDFFQYCCSLYSSIIILCK